MIDKLITFYLDYLNSGVSINDFATKHEISCSECLVLLNAGRRLAALQKIVLTPSNKKSYENSRKTAHYS